MEDFAFSELSLLRKFGFQVFLLKPSANLQRITQIFPEETNDFELMSTDSQT